MKAQWTDFITLLKREVVPALGCTEPMSVALAAANCRKLLGQDPTRVSVWVSGNLFKNGMGVGVPGTGMIGLPVAAAVGITGGNPDAGLEVLKTLTPDQVDAAKALLPAIKVDVKDVPDVLYAEVLAEGRARCGEALPLSAMGHAYLAAGQLSELSERRVLGGNQHALPADLFAAADYTALGHLHLAQSPAEGVHYSGSPLPLSLLVIASPR